MSWEVAAMTAVTATAVGVSAHEAKKARESAEEQAEKARAQQEEFFERQAGEFADITREQMHIQALQGQTKMLSELIQIQTKPIEFYKLPTDEPSSPVERINKAIGDFIKGIT